MKLNSSMSCNNTTTNIWWLTQHPAFSGNKLTFTLRQRDSNCQPFKTACGCGWEVRQKMPKNSKWKDLPTFTHFADELQMLTCGMYSKIHLKSCPILLLLFPIIKLADETIVIWVSRIWTDAIRKPRPLSPAHTGNVLDGADGFPDLPKTPKWTTWGKSLNAWGLMNAVKKKTFVFLHFLLFWHLSH